MIFPGIYAEPLRRLNACYGKLFVTDNVAKRSFDANTNAGLTSWIFIARKQNLQLNAMGCHILHPKVSRKIVFERNGSIDKVSK
jgi:hypothetical protein